MAVFGVTGVVAKTSQGRWQITGAFKGRRGKTVGADEPGDDEHLFRLRRQIAKNHPSLNLVQLAVQGQERSKAGRAQVLDVAKVDHHLVQAVRAQGFKEIVAEPISQLIPLQFLVKQED